MAREHPNSSTDYTEYTLPQHCAQRVADYRVSRRTAGRATGRRRYRDDYFISSQTAKLPRAGLGQTLTENEAESNT